MSGLIPDYVVAQIFKLNLPMRLIADSKVAFPMLYKNRIGKDMYTVMVNTGVKDVWQFRSFEIELKGKVDIEYLKYRGEVKLAAIKGEPDYYRMTQVRLYKVNDRAFKRVPYRRSIEITAPIQTSGILINISASGAMIQCDEKIEGDSINIAFTLLKKNMELSATIIEQVYNEELETYCIRCYFDTIDERTRKIISQAVKEITLMAKRRLQG